MDGLILAGAALSLAGLGGILWCIVTVWRAKRAGLDDAALRARLQRIVTVNLAALLISALGLGLIAVGLILA
ncbi:MAG: hypothetical protein V2I65_15750 [Paracoccaceae bacterium]|jgi:hypothetical protein|nr:hypothetical protein [Paracoccaceae bacterium]